MRRSKDAAHGSRGGRGKRIAVVVTALALTAGLAAGAVALSTHAREPSGPPAGAARLSTAPVKKTDLSDSRTLAGTLGFGTSTAVKGTGTGVVTALPAPGTVVKRGRALYSVNDQPVVVFYGGTPLFRTLEAPGDDGHPAHRTELRGRDVTVVADNLQALGYDIGPRTAASPAEKGAAPHGRGDAYTPALAAAVERWQRYVGMTPTGTLGVGQILVLPGRVRVSTVQAQLGDPAAEPLLAVTPTAKTVTVPVDATDTAGMVTGARVRITLPSTKEIDGTITAVGQTVQGGGDDPSGGSTPPKLTVTVTPENTGEVAALTAAAVQVRFTSSTRKGVLTVPVGALVALGEGGYAVQRTDGTLLGVTTGLFADGLVEVSGDGLAAGLRVETAS